MERPTEEQIKALKPGDRVLVEAVVDRLIEHEGFPVVRVASPTPYLATESWTAPSAIHSILPREIKVGDRVRRRGCSGRVYEVVNAPRTWNKGLHTEVALWSDESGYTSDDPANLEVVS